MSENVEPVSLTGDIAVARCVFPAKTHDWSIVSEIYSVDVSGAISGLSPQLVAPKGGLLNNNTIKNVSNLF